MAIEDVLKFARSTKEKSRGVDDTSAVISQLRTQIQEQEKLLKAMTADRGERVGLMSGSGGGRYGATEGVEMSEAIGKRALDASVQRKVSNPLVILIAIQFFKSTSD